MCVMRRILSAGLAVAVCLGLTACSGDLPHLTSDDPSPQPSASPAPSQAPLSLALAPAAGTADAPISTEIGIDLTGGAVEQVSVVKAGSSAAIAGSMREDGSAWVPAAPLEYGASYEATVTVKSASGETKTEKTSFGTMRRPGVWTGTGLYAFDGQTVGVAMPVVVEFTRAVPEEARAQVQKRLFVSTNPPQPGIWHWASGNQVWYRGPNYWQPGTKITIRSALAGVPMGNGSFGDTDRSASVTVGNKVFMVADNANKQMQVYVDDQLARTIPVSLGKPSTPSSYGFMVVMSKHEQTTFDTRGEPNGGYVVDVTWAMRLTWGGEFIHAAPWSVGQQGNTNVSHGCVNMSTEHARWLFDTAHIGDPIIVKGTEVPVVHGNGWTAWNLTWADYVKGSALPVSADLAAMKGVDPLTGLAPKPSSVNTRDEEPDAAAAEPQAS